jgi:ADP-ribosyl-[dinitrogen reductase] hydrolase
MSEIAGARARVVGAMVGLAAGDALGGPVEFEPRAAREADPVRGMRGGGTWKLEPGTWSDDASLALCLAESIVLKGFDPEDSGHRGLAWLDEGLWSSRGEAFGVGGATRRALDRIRSGMPAILAGGRGENDNGNGSLMRILPASIWLGRLPEPARFRAVAAYSSTTHGHPRSILGCWLHSLVAGKLLEGAAPAKAYAAAMSEARTLLGALPASARAEAGAYSRVLDGELPSLPSRAVRGSGYVVHCLEAALWCLATTTDFAACVLAAVNLGEDADTTGAVAGGLAGLAYGRDAIPADWAKVLARLPEIEALAGNLAELALAPAPLPRSYWVLPGKLLAGAYPGREAVPGGPAGAVDRLLGAGVDAFLDLTEDGEGGRGSYAGLLGARSSSTGIKVERRAAPSKDMSSDPEAIHRALGELDALLAAGRTPYVHCQGGLGRTGTVVASWLVEKGLAPPDGASELVVALRASTDSPDARTPETEEQSRLVASRRPGPSALTLY